MRAPGKKRLTLGGLLLVLGCMIGLVAASVPLYRLFCAATGYNGTSQRAETAPATEVANRLVTVRFDATTSPELDWDFHPETLSVQVHPGETKTVAYRAVNRSSPPVTGTAAAGSGLPGQTTVIARTDGSNQLTYDGHPLYTYIGDTAPGEARGNNLNLTGGLWHEVPASP